MTRTTLDLNPSVLRELRRRGERDHKSMGEVASELLATALARADQGVPTRRFQWISADLGVPHVDLEDKEGLRRALDPHA